MTFEFQAFEITLQAVETIVFPPVIPANVLRGGFGLTLRRVACTCGTGNSHGQDCLYARLFEPVQTASSGPSGFRDPPRPFVFRARSLDGLTVEPGISLRFVIHLFENRFPAEDLLRTVFWELGKAGLGPTRGRADLIGMSRQNLAIDLDSSLDMANQVRVDFLTPTELKGGEEPAFPTLFSRVRDRISTLRALYGPGPLDIDFWGMGQRASAISMDSLDISHSQAARQSTRTGQRHSLGGFVGSATYAGDLEEFLPYLQAGAFTGVGRQTVWGKGELSVEPLRPDQR